MCPSLRLQTFIINNTMVYYSKLPKLFFVFALFGLLTILFFASWCCFLNAARSRDIMKSKYTANELVWLVNQHTKQFDSHLKPILEPDCKAKNPAKSSTKVRKLFSHEQVRSRLSSCEKYFKSFPVDADLKMDSEIKSGLVDPGFQLAFSHLVHKDFGTLEMFLSIVFRPHNIHCIHVDRKAPDYIHEDVAALAQCYNSRFNTESVFVIRDPIAVYWGHISVLEADLKCLQELLVRHSTWSYYINTAGSELPIVPYPTFEAWIKKENGRNILESYRYGKKRYDLTMARTSVAKPNPPFNMTIYKGTKNVIITRSFAHFALQHPVAIQLKHWLEDVYVPDENFFQTLSRIVRITTDKNQIGHLDQAYQLSDHFNFVTQDLWTKKDYIVVQDDELNTARHFYPRYTMWAFSKKRCHGKWIRVICNFALADLDSLRSQNALIANKFNFDIDPLAPVCQWKYLKDFDYDKLNALNITF